MVDGSFNNFYNLINRLRQGEGNRLTPPLEDERSILAFMTSDSDDDSDESGPMEVKVENAAPLQASHVDEPPPKLIDNVKLPSQAASNAATELTPLLDPEDEEVEGILSAMDRLLSPVEAMVVRPVVVPRVDAMRRPLVTQPPRDMASRRWLFNSARVEQNLPPCYDPTCTMCIPDFPPKGACGPVPPTDARAGNTGALVLARTDNHVPSMAMCSSVPSTSYGATKRERNTYFDNFPKWSQTRTFEAPKGSGIFKDELETTVIVPSGPYPEWNVKLPDKSPPWVADFSDGVPEWKDAFQDEPPKRDADSAVGSGQLIAATTDTDEAKPGDAAEEAVRDVQEFIRKYRTPEHLRQCAQLAWPPTAKDLTKRDEKKPLKDAAEGDDENTAFAMSDDEWLYFDLIYESFSDDESD